MKQTLGKKNEEGLGLTFAANVFGHYNLLKKLVDCLEKSKLGARVIWCSSTTAAPEFFNIEDYQCLKG
jgi:hypothetical protein